MPLIFPTNPTPNQTYQSGSSATYRWNGVYWVTDVAPTATVITATSASFASTGSSVNSLSQVVTITGSLIASGSTLITGSFAVSTGSGIEFQVLSDGIKAGNLVSDRHQVTGSLQVTGSITGSLFGTASFATTASYARSASFVIGGTIPTWTVAGAVIGATATPPTIVGTTRAAHNYRQIGPKEIEFTFILDYNGTGGANGNGDYLITLPGGYSIDTTLANQTIYTGGVGLSDNNFYRYTVPGGYGWWSITAGTAGWGVQPIVYDATRIRFMILNYGSYIRCWGSNALGVTAGIYLTARYTFQVV